MRHLLFDFDIAHRALIDQFVKVFGYRVEAGHNTVVFSSGMIRELVTAS
jgi:hypothetical protein